MLWTIPLAAEPGNQSVYTALSLIGVVIVAVLAGAWILARLRKRMLGDRAGADDSISIVAELRRLHEHGEITDEQFKQSMDRLAARLKTERPTRADTRVR